MTHYSGYDAPGIALAYLEQQLKEDFPVMSGVLPLHCCMPAIVLKLLSGRCFPFQLHSDISMCLQTCWIDCLKAAGILAYCMVRCEHM